MLNAIGLTVIALFSWIGFRRGALRMSASLIALALAGLLGQWTAGIGAALSSGYAPLALQRPAGLLVMGFIWFAAISLPMEFALRKREKHRVEQGEARLQPWDSWTGLALGGAWGLALCTLIFTGVSAAGRAQRAMRRAQAISAYREHHPSTVWVQVDESQLNMAPAENFEIMTLQVEESFFAPVVDKVNPISTRVERTLSDLSVVSNDPVLFEIFRAQPKVQALMQNPKLMELASDPGVAQAVLAGDYRSLLDQPKLAALLEDKQLVQQLKELDLEDTLQRLRSTRAK